MQNQKDKKVRYPNIDAERARKHLSMDELAAVLTVSKKTIYNWINSGNIPQRALEKMSKEFGVSIDYLLNREEDDHNETT